MSTDYIGYIFKSGITVLLQNRVSQIFSVRYLVANILDFVDHAVSAVTTKLCCCSTKEAKDISM